MKNYSILVFTFLFFGCASSDVQYDSIKREPTSQIDIFRGGERPDRQFKEIATLVDDAREVEEPQVEADMIKKAKRMGGNAIIFVPKKLNGSELTGLATWSRTYLYKARVIAYEARGRAVSADPSYEVQDRQMEIALVGRWECSSGLSPLSQRSGVSRLVMEFMSDNQVVAVSFGKSPDSQPYEVKGTYAVRGNRLIVYSPGSPPDPAFFTLSGNRFVMWTSEDDRTVFQRTPNTPASK